MEKFGIFELLDALSAALEQENAPSSSPDHGQTFERNGQNEHSPLQGMGSSSHTPNGVDRESGRPSHSLNGEGDDRTMASGPSHGPNGDDRATKRSLTSPRMDDAVFAPPDYAGGAPNPALSSLLSRHEEMSRKIKPNKE